MNADSYQGRRVVTGTDADGRSCVLLDELSGTRAATPAFTVVDLWQTDSVPASVADDDTLTGTVTLDPPKAGVLVRMLTLPPDPQSPSDGVFKTAMAEVGGSETTVEGSGIAGLHATDTLDVITVLSGEIHLVLETGEVLLRAGDTIVQRGTKHAWSNRTSESVTLVGTMLPATR